MQKYFVWLFAFILLILLALGGTIFYLSRNGKLSLSFNNQPIPQVQQEKQTDQNAQFVSLFNSGNFSELNQQLDSQLSNNPNDFNLLLQKAHTLAQEASLTFKEKELGDKAMTYVDKALAMNASSTEALTLKGYIYEIQQDYPNAHKYYDMALKIDPNYVPALDQKGHAYSLQGKLVEAENFFKKALVVDPNYQKSLLNLARVYLMQLKDSSAEPLFQKALTLTQNSRDKSDIYYSLGTIRERQAKDNEALSYYNQAIAADPNSSLPYVGLARINFKNHDAKSSFDNLKKALDVNPNQSNAVLQLALEFAALGDKTSAKQILQKLPDVIKKDISLTESTRVLMLKSAQFLLQNIDKTK